MPRSRLLRQKLIVALAYSGVGVTYLTAMALLAGTVAFGWHPLPLPGTGIQLPAGAALGRLAIVLVSELVVAALAFLLSVPIDSPLSAVGGAVAAVSVAYALILLALAVRLFRAKDITS